MCGVSPNAFQPGVLNVLFVLSVIILGRVSAIDYCSLCDNHTMCIYKGLGNKCGYTSSDASLTEEEKKVIVDTHNALRALVATGGEARGYPGPQPSATDMQILEWDEDLARTAQAWADQCDFGHDACRSDPRFGVGQNVFLSEGGVPWDRAILSWYSEVQFMDNANVDNFIFDEVTGHYAQIVWANTRLIGCGKRTYPQRPRRYYKRDTGRAEQLEPKSDQNLQEVQDENVRQARRIDYYQQNSGNQLGDQKGYQNYNKPGQQVYNQPQEYHQQNQNNSSGRTQIALQTSDIHKKQLQFYKSYSDQMKLLDSPYLSYEKKAQLYYELQRKHELLENIHKRVLYHDEKLKDKIARTKKLNPYIPKQYSFQPDRNIIAGQVFEYYVCNYGPSGLWPGARMYNKGRNQCPYGGLCKDPLTVSYYAGLDRKNDPILSVLYNN